MSDAEYIRAQAAGWIDIGLFHREYNRNPPNMRPETADGPGATLALTQDLIPWIEDLLERREIGTMLDMACGDWSWMRMVNLGQTEYCVDEETTILTSDGWRRYDQIKAGDHVLTLNHKTGLSEWRPIEAVNVFNGTREMLSIESKTHSSLTTMDHRWPVIRQWVVNPAEGKRFRRERRDWATSAKYSLDDCVPIAAECADLPAEPKYQDALVECVAWFCTEGSIHGRGVGISQSPAANPEHCERIRSALTRAFGPATPWFPNRGRSTLQIPRWKETPSRNENFRLNAEAGDVMQQHAPGRVPTHDFLLSLTKAQLELFIQTSLYADGYERTKNYERTLCQKDPAAAEAFQFACILAGHGTSSGTNRFGTRLKYGYDMNCVSIRQQRRFMLARGKHTRVMHSGVVWCPTTSNGTWLAQRRGKCYFTGNTGWDVDPGRIEVCQRRVAHADFASVSRPNTVFEVVNALTVDPIPGAYDLVLAREFLTHITNEHVLNILAKLRAGLDPAQGGNEFLLASTFPGADNTMREWHPERATWQGYLEAAIDLSAAPFNLGEPLESFKELPGPHGILTIPRELALFKL